MIDRQLYLPATPVFDPTGNRHDDLAASVPGCAPLACPRRLAQREHAVDRHGEHAPVSEVGRDAQAGVANGGRARADVEVDDIAL